MEYWAEGVQSWFDTNREFDHDHNHVNTRAELKEYDSPLAGLVAEVFGDGAWRYQKPTDCPQAAHLAGHDPSKASVLSWPAELLDWNLQYQAQKQGGSTNIAELVLMLPDTNPAPVSKRTNVETSILFINQTREVIQVFWVDWEGRRQSLVRVRPGESHQQHTFNDHVWVVTDLSDKPLAMATAANRPGRAVNKSANQAQGN